MSATPKKTQLRFSGHETFVFRYPWLAKGVSGIANQPSLFSEDEAIVSLGVGRNMVSSIRHWCDVMQLIEPINQGKGGYQPTQLGGHLVLDSTTGVLADELKGWDPFLEDVGTLWLLHYLLVSREDRASTWHLVFTQFGKDTFTRELLLDWLTKRAEGAEARASRASIERDLQVFLRTYLPARSSREAFNEDSFDCPLVELGLLNELDNGSYGFNRERRLSLPDGVFEYALMDYWAATVSTRESLSFEQLMYGVGSPGAAFKLMENELAERLERLPTDLEWEYRETAGTRALYGTPVLTSEARLKRLDRHYHAVQGGAHD